MWATWVITGVATGIQACLHMRIDSQLYRAMTQ